MQQLKGLTRKLLAAASLPAEFWPLAVLHGSVRSWVSPCQDLGVPQPVLLPFGMKIEAGQRTATGYQSHWRPRTISGFYLGQAPHTPGGHLALVPDGSKSKVLLTNAVYPVGPLERAVPPKPRFRIRAKVGPDLVFRGVRAISVAVPGPVPMCFVPGCHLGGSGM